MNNIKSKFKILNVKNLDKPGCNHLNVTVEYNDDSSVEEICFHISNFDIAKAPEDETEVFKFLHKTCKEENIKTKELFAAKIKNKKNF